MVRIRRDKKAAERHSLYSSRTKKKEDSTGHSPKQKMRA